MKYGMKGSAKQNPMIERNWESQITMRFCFQLTTVRRSRSFRRRGRTRHGAGAGSL